MYNLLQKGSFINFKIKGRGFIKLYLMIDDKIIRELTPMNNETFIAESVFIFGNKVKILKKTENKDDVILEYNTINNINIQEDPSFPKVYLKGYNQILYSPLTNTLIKGKSYFFKIKSELKEIAAFDGNDIIKLKKEDKLFTGYIKIRENTEILDIIENNDSSDEYNILYKYNISNSIY